MAVVAARATHSKTEPSFVLTTVSGFARSGSFEDGPGPNWSVVILQYDVGPTCYLAVGMFW